MACITITIWHTGSGNDAVIGFTATDGDRTLTGDRAFGWGGYGTPTDTEYKKIVTPYILEWFGVTELCPIPPPGNGQPISPIIPIIVLAAVAYFIIKGRK